jgi:hypothetical protein
MGLGRLGTARARSGWVEDTVNQPLASGLDVHRDAWTLAGLLHYASHRNWQLGGHPSIAWDERTLDMVLAGAPARPDM